MGKIWPSHHDLKLYKNTQKIQFIFYSNFERVSMRRISPKYIKSEAFSGALSPETSPNTSSSSSSLDWDGHQSRAHSELLVIWGNSKIMVDHGGKIDESETSVSEPSSSSSSAALAWDTHQQLIHPYFVNGTTSSVRNHHHHHHHYRHYYYYHHHHHHYFVNGTTSSVRNHWKKRTHPDSTTDDKTKIETETY